MSTPDSVVRADARLSSAAALQATDELADVIITNERNEVLGMLTNAQIQQLEPTAQAMHSVHTMLTSHPVLVTPDRALDVALEKVANQGMSWAPVVEGKRLVGRLHIRDALQTYRATLERSVRRVSALTAGTWMFEVRLDTTSPLVGQTLRGAGVYWPGQRRLARLQRDRQAGCATRRAVPSV